MVDFSSMETHNIKTITRVKDYAKYKGSNDYLKSEETGEIVKIDKYSHRGLELSVHPETQTLPERLKIKGSHHYVFNGKKYNGNDMYFNDYTGLIWQLEKELYLNPEDCIIKSMEFATMGTPTGFDAINIALNAFYWGNRPFTNMKDILYGKEAGSRKNVDTTFKIYCRPGNPLRTELHFNRARELNDNGIFNLSDLLIKENHFQLYKLIHKAVQGSLIYDYTIDQSLLSNTQQRKGAKFANFNHWVQIHRDRKETGKYRNKFKVHKDSHLRMSQRYGQNLQSKLAETIINKGIQLLNYSQFQVKGIPKNGATPGTFKTKNNLLPLQGICNPVSFKSIPIQPISLSTNPKIKNSAFPGICIGGVCTINTFIKPLPSVLLNPPQKSKKKSKAMQGFWSTYRPPAKR